MICHGRTSLLSEKNPVETRRAPTIKMHISCACLCLFVSLACYNLYTCFSADVWHHLSLSTDGIYLDLWWDADLGQELPFQSVLQEAVSLQLHAAAPKGWLKSSRCVWEGTWQFSLNTSANALSSERHVLCCALVFLCCHSTCAVSPAAWQRGEEMGLCSDSTCCITRIVVMGLASGSNLSSNADSTTIALWPYTITLTSKNLICKSQKTHNTIHFLESLWGLSCTFQVKHLEHSLEYRKL